MLAFTFLAVLTSSGKPMTDRIEVSLRVMMNWLMIEGIIVRMACGSTTLYIAFQYGQAKAAGGLHLALVHALDTGADDLGHIGTAVQRQADDAGLQRRKGEFAAGHGCPVQVVVHQHRHAEIDEERQNDHRHAADNIDKDRGDDVADAAFSKR